LREVTKKYDHLVVFIRHNSAEIRGFRYGLTLGIGNLKMLASSGVFVHAVSTLKRFISYASLPPRMILTNLNQRKSQVGPERDFYERTQRKKKNRTLTESSSRFDTIHCLEA
jgi:hypothetical protein